MKKNEGLANDNGFSLVELLVALTLFAFLLTVLFDTVPKLAKALDRQHSAQAVQTGLLNVALLFDRFVGRRPHSNDAVVISAQPQSVILRINDQEIKVLLLSKAGEITLYIEEQAFPLHTSSISFEYLTRAGEAQTSQWLPSTNPEEVVAIRASITNHSTTMNVLLWDGVVATNPKRQR